MKWREGETVAGHHFFPAGICGCGRRWLDIRNTTSRDLDATGIAHAGKLSAHEVEQIRQWREREDADLAAAMGGVSGRRPDKAALDEDWRLFWKLSARDYIKLYQYVVSGLVSLKQADD